MEDELELKQQLVELYESKKDDFKLIYEKYENQNINGPLLMSPSRAYSSSKTQFLVVGKETAGWEQFDIGISQLLSCYENFNVGEAYNRKGSPMWHLVRFTENALGNSRHSCMWTNLSKYDQNKKEPDAKHREDFSKFDTLLKDEITILKPGFCLFLTGYKFDTRLENIFEDLQFIPVEGFEPQILVQLKSPDLPDFCYRTSHPRWLSLQNKKSQLKDRVELFISETANSLEN